MRFCVLILLTVAFVAGPTGAYAQDDPALDTVRAALDDFAQANTYTGDIHQAIDQFITITYLDETVALTQTVKMEGAIAFQKAPEQRYDARQMDFVQSITQSITGSGLDDNASIGPVTFNVLAVDDRFYLRVQADDPAVAAQFPDGWRDITDGADAFPGMSLYDIEGLFAIGGNLTTEYVDGLLGAVTSIALEPAADTGDRLARYRMDLDPAKTLDLIGLPAMTDMFSEGRVPFDIPALIERMFNDESTTYTVWVTVDPSTDTLINYVGEWHMDVEITPDLITDPSLEGATMTIEQDVTQLFRPTTVNEPVTITAPEIVE